MSKPKEHPAEQSSRKAKKLTNPNTRGKNYAGQTNGQFEQNPKNKKSPATGAGEPPRNFR